MRWVVAWDGLICVRCCTWSLRATFCFALLAPNASQVAALNGSEAWVTEVKDMLKNSIGLSLKTRGKWDSVSAEL